MVTRLCLTQKHTVNSITKNDFRMGVSWVKILKGNWCAWNKDDILCFDLRKWQNQLHCILRMHHQRYHVWFQSNVYILGKFRIFNIIVIVYCVSHFICTLIMWVRELSWTNLNVSNSALRSWTTNNIHFIFLHISGVHGLFWIWCRVA